ncbi:NLR family CARD domain-containing protein 3, partial [Geodia barretti]
MSLMFSNRKRPGLSEVTMIVFVNQMLLMMAGDVERNPGPDTLTTDDLATLVNELNEVKDKWYHLGVQLKMKPADLNAIRIEFMNNANNCLLEMLSVWLTKLPSPPTWQTVVDALSSPDIDRPAVAQRIRQTYLSQDPASAATDTVKKKQHFLTTEQIESRMEELENEFETLKDDVYESVKTQPVDVFKVKLTSFKIRDKECHMDHMKKMIHQKITVTDIWVELNQYFNFLNHTILQHILTKFPNKQLQSRMDEYRERLYSFFTQTRLCDFLQCWPMMGQDCPTKELREFVVKSSEDWETCTLADLDNLKGKLATKLLLPDFTFILTRASRGCLELTFSIPPSLVNYLHTIVKATELTEFGDMEIETITVDGVVCYVTPLLQYTTLLKQLYTSRSPLTPLSDSKPKPLLPFRLARIEKQSLSQSNMDRFTRESLRGDMDDVVYKKTAMELSQLGVIGDGSPPQVVLIEGAPGVGKTTFAWHQCRQWAEGKLLQAYSIVLLLPLRDDNVRQIRSLSSLFQHSRGQVREEVSRRVAESGGAGCLIWLEAWDELPGDLRSDSLFTELIQGIQLPAATIFITTRPWATGSLLERVGDRLSQHTELLALAKEEVENQITAMIVAIHSQTSADSGFHFSKFIESNPVIRAAMYTPVSAAIVEQVFKSAPHNPPTTVTGLYSAFVLMRLEQHLSEHPEYSHMNIKVRTLADLPERVLGDLQ